MSQTTSDAAVAAPEQKAKKAPSTTKVRVLRDIELEGEVFKPNDVVEFLTSTAERLVSEGAVDATPEAVAYAESLSPAT